VEESLYRVKSGKNVTIVFTREIILAILVAALKELFIKNKIYSVRKAREMFFFQMIHRQGQCPYFYAINQFQKKHEDESVWFNF
jgi:hypothetical protein